MDALRKAAEQTLEAWSQCDYEIGKYMDTLRDALAQQAEPVKPVATLTAQRDALLEALRLMMDCAGDIATAPDSMLEMALNYDDEETRRQANAFLVARAAIKAVEGEKK